MNVMEQKESNTELINDQALVETLIGLEALNTLNNSIKEVPDNYFETFPESMINTIRAKNNQAKIIRINSFKRIAVAAAILLITATGYIFYDKVLPNSPVQSMVQIQEITNEEIENYLETNEWFVEVDWQSEMDDSNDELASNYILTNNDTNKLNN